ncbi:MAG: HD domain-containing protein [Blautia sp.]|nr:HD domain-containing protein [Blautia sp.]
MKKWKIYQIFLFVVFCILLNLAGNEFASRYSLMVWLDSFGTVLCAYLGGPVCGCIVGITGNLIMGMMLHTSYAYALTSVMIGVIVGLAAKKDYLATALGTMTVSAVTALAAIVVSVPLDILFYDGSIGNIWGNGVASFLEERGWPWLLTVVMGHFYVEFLDKFFTLLVLSVILRIWRRVRSRRDNGPVRIDKEEFGRVFKAVPIFLALALSLNAREAAAEPDSGDYFDYNDCIQTVFSSNNGLPCGEANDIVETNDGILWIGTYAGLYRYNGREFRWMDEYDSVRNVNCLFVDEEGRLFIGTNDNGLSILINEKISNVIDQSQNLPSNSVRSVIRGADGYYYVGTTSSMQILTLNNGLKTVSTLREINYADKSAADENGNVVVVTSDGRMFLLNSGHILSSLQLSQEEGFNCCCFDPDGNLLAGTSSDRILSFDVSGGRFKKIRENKCIGLSQLNDLYFLENGIMFVAADNGIGYFDTSGVFRKVNVNEFNNSVDNVLLDYQGNLWLTSSRLGLLRLAQSSFKDVYSTAGMKDRVVNAVTRWQGEYYFGTDTGLDIVDNNCHKQIKNDLTGELEGVRIRCLSTDATGSLWICTYGSGLWEIERDGTKHVFDPDHGTMSNRFRLGISLSDGKFAAASDKDLSFYRDHKLYRSVRYSEGLIHSMILTMTELPDGSILAGTDGDGLAVIEDGYVRKILTRNDGLSSDVILRTVMDPGGEGVFLVTSNGLCFMDNDLSVRPIQNFPYFNNYDIWVKNDETLFVLSSAGIYVVSRDDLIEDREGMSFDLLDSKRGLNSAITANSWNYSDGNGALFLPCDKGVFIMDTDRYSESSRSYRMSLNNIRFDGVPYKMKRNNVIRIGRGVHRLEIFPEIINYTIQDPNAGYYMEGIDDDWNIMPQSSLSSIVYTNLPNGSYKLHLAVFDDDRENILEERIFQVIKEKELYDESWFIYYILGVAALFVLWIPWFFMQRALDRARQRIRMGNETIMAIANTVDAKDTSTSQHSYRVSLYSVQIAERMGFSKKECENIRQAARMHDIGKIGIPDSILNKPGRLTDEEYAVMKSHVTMGSEILQGFTLIDHVVEGASYHHERYDGKGYPYGLKGEEIPLYGRIIGVADAFDAMTANRIYRKKMDLDYVLGEMRRGRGTQFDPKCVDIMLELIEDGTIDAEKIYSDMIKKNDPDASGDKEGGS